MADFSFGDVGNWFSEKASDVGSWFSKGDNLKGFGTILGGGAALYGGLEQAKMAKNMYNLQKSAYDRAVKKEDEAEDEMQAGFMASGLGQPLVKLG